MIKCTLLPGSCFVAFFVCFVHLPNDRCDSETLVALYNTETILTASSFVSLTIFASLAVLCDDDIRTFCWNTIIHNFLFIQLFYCCCFFFGLVVYNVIFYCNFIFFYFCYIFDHRRMFHGVYVYVRVYLYGTTCPLTFC